MRNKALATLATLACVFAGNPAHAQRIVLGVQPDSKLWIEGTSNVHDWTCSADHFSGVITSDAAITNPDAESFPKLLQSVQVKVPVAALHCGHGKMDENMYKALKAASDPDVSYILGTFAVVPGAVAGEYTVKTAGHLTIADSTNAIEMDVTARRLSDGTLRAEGAVHILMSDYGIKPPTAMLGMLKTGNEVTVKFQLDVARSTASQAAAAVGTMREMQ